MVDGSGSFFTVNNHWTSKGGSSSLQGDARPPVNGGVDRRTRQSEVTGAFIAEILKQDKNAAIVVAGDFNEFATVEPLRRFVEVSGLKDLDVVAKVPEQESYTYTFGGSQQQLDHMYASSWAARKVGRKDFEHVHVNTWAAEEDVASDHDPSVARLNVCSR
jgi:predicted extracellular nuclease